MEKARNIKSVIEFGSNIGLNLKAIKLLLPMAEISAIEINKKAIEILKEQDIKIYNQSILEIELKEKYDFVFTKVVLIHINPSELQAVYEKMYNASNAYIFMAEYYNPTPVTVKYRENEDKLFKRDFAGEMMDKYPNLKLIDYGFCYGRDNNYTHGSGDINWFLMEK